MKQFFVARFTNGYSIEVYILENKDNSPCQFHLIPCGIDGKPHTTVNECEISEEQLAPTLDYLQLQMELVDTENFLRHMEEYLDTQKEEIDSFFE